MAIPSDTPIPLIDVPLVDNRAVLGYHLMMDSEGHVDPLASDFLDALYDLTFQQIVVLNDAMAYNPGALAEIFYGDPRLAWVIMAYNGATSAAQFVSGIQVRVPEKTRLFALLSKIAKRTDGRAVTRTVSL